MVALSALFVCVHAVQWGLQVDRDLKLIDDLGLTLTEAINTHCHADHITSTGKIKVRQWRFSGSLHYQDLVPSTAADSIARSAGHAAVASLQHGAACEAGLKLGRASPSVAC